MSQNDETGTEPGFKTPRAQSKGSPLNQSASAAYQDLQLERDERQLRTERLRKLRMAAEKSE